MWRGTAARGRSGEEEEEEEGRICGEGKESRGCISDGWRGCGREAEAPLCKWASRPSSFPVAMRSSEAEFATHDTGILRARGRGAAALSGKRAFLMNSPLLAGLASPLYF
jgi:hypothetical protein